MYKEEKELNREKEIFEDLKEDEAEIKVPIIVRADHISSKRPRKSKRAPQKKMIKRLGTQMFRSYKLSSSRRPSQSFASMSSMNGLS